MKYIVGPDTYVIKHVNMRITGEFHESMYANMLRQMNRRELPYYHMFQFIGDYYYGLYYKLGPGGEQ